MASQSEYGNARPAPRERPDLRRQYRPIGIGAVAAALTAAGGDSERRKAQCDGQDRDEPMAA